MALAEAALSDILSLQQDGTRPAQVAVIGPTQVGKSTSVNLLLGLDAATVSPLAGFTRHPQGFGLDIDSDEPTWLNDFFPGRTRTTQELLNKDELNCYTYTTIDSAQDNTLGTPCAVWDTPDFDSLSAEHYRQGVLETCAHADLIVLVLSKEKYSDLAVWETLKLITLLQRPLLICLNKITADSVDLITRSLRQRLTQIGTDISDTEIITLPFSNEIGKQKTLEAEVTLLRDKIHEHIHHLDRTQRIQGVKRLLETYWPSWIAPVQQEHHARAQWSQDIDTVAAQAMTIYRRDYLDHPQRYDTFKRAIVELLSLLELPVLAKPMIRVRHILTWPARKLSSARDNLRSNKTRDTGGEEQILSEIVMHAYITLLRDSNRRCEKFAAANTFWQALSRQLDDRQDPLQEQFTAAIQRHHEDFEPEVHAAAKQLYARLQEKPALLNTLRATRVTTDAAAILIAIKSGGLGINDLLFAPAMLALTSSLTEGALGSYMNKVARDLKQRQYDAAEQQVFDLCLKPQLHAVADELRAPGLFNITADELVTAEKALTALNHE